MNDQLTIIIGWIVAIIIFTVIEISTLGLATVWFAIGSLIALIAAFFNVPLYVQIILFLSSSIVLLAFTRPILIDYLKLGKAKTNLDSIIDSTGIVLDDIHPFQMGKVKVNGQIWSAISENNKTILKDSKVVICSIQGVKLLVKEEKEE